MSQRNLPYFPPSSLPTATRYRKYVMVWETRVTANQLSQSVKRVLWSLTQTPASPAGLSLTLRPESSLQAF